MIWINDMQIEVSFNDEKWNPDDPPFFIPDDPTAWAKQLHQAVVENLSLRISISTTDAAPIAVCIAAEQDYEGNAFQAMRHGKALGFTVNLEAAEQLQAAFALMVANLKSQKGG